LGFGRLRAWGGWGGVGDGVGAGSSVPPGEGAVVDADRPTGPRSVQGGRIRGVQGGCHPSVIRYAVAGYPERDTALPGYDDLAVVRPAMGVAAGNGSGLCPVLRLLAGLDCPLSRRQRHRECGPASAASVFLLVGIGGTDRVARRVGRRRSHQRTSDEENADPRRHSNVIDGHHYLSVFASAQGIVGVNCESAVRGISGVPAELEITWFRTGA
jgi:hypothetical protein